MASDLKRHLPSGTFIAVMVLLIGAVVGIFI